MMALPARQEGGTPTSPTAIAWVQTPSVSAITVYPYPSLNPSFSIFILPSRTIYFAATASSISYTADGSESFAGQSIVILDNVQRVIVGTDSVILDITSLYVTAVATMPPTVQVSTLPNPASTGVLSSISVFGSISASATEQLPTSAPTTPPSLQSPQAKAPALAVGAIAGIAVGSFLAGAFIAGFLLWAFRGRPHKQRLARDSEASSVALIRTEKGPTARALSLTSGSPISHILENGLPQPLEDRAISGEISKISNLIKNHVQSFYHSGRISPGLLDLDDLQALGNDLPISTGTLSTLLGNSDTRELALRFCIAWVVVSRMRLHSDKSITLLPPEITTCFQSMPAQGNRSRGQAMYLAKWRVLTAELMQSTYGRSAFAVTDPRTHNIEKATNTLDSVLRIYADLPTDTTQRRRNLEEILKRAANFAFILFSQAGSWDFDWQDHEGVQSGSLCIFPALLQVLDDAGECIKPPRAFSDAVVRRLDG